MCVCARARACVLGGRGFGFQSESTRYCLQEKRGEHGSREAAAAWEVAVWRAGLALPGTFCAPEKAW